MRQRAVKLYVQEQGSERMLEITAALERIELAALELTRVEARSAIRQRERQGDFVSSEANRLISRMDLDFDEVFPCQPTSPQVIEEACRLLDHYPLKADDAMQLGGCVAFAPAATDSVTFVSSGENLLRAAEAEGFEILNPASL